MYKKVCLFSCLIIVLTTVQSKTELLNLAEGDICKEESEGTLWTCKHYKSCVGLSRKLRAGHIPAICSFISPKNEPVVCCEPQVEELPTRGSKAKEMCKKYAKSVFVENTDPRTLKTSLKDTCSTAVELILGGENAKPKEFPHMALIGYGRKGFIEWLCGGSLISERYVISAAHCSYPRRRGAAKWVRLGEYNKMSKVDDEEGNAYPTDYEIIEITNHPEYNALSTYNDISLYKLNTDVEFNEFVRPICLQTEYLFANTFATATGWGNTEFRGSSSDVLQKVNITLTSRENCSDAYRGVRGQLLKDGIKDESQMCAGDYTSKKDTCQGDSGGPLQILNEEPYCTYSLVGVTSFGIKCGKSPGVYTRVSHFVPWIESVVWP